MNSNLGIKNKNIVIKICGSNINTSIMNSYNGYYQFKNSAIYYNQIVYNINKFSIKDYMALYMQTKIGSLILIVTKISRTIFIVRLDLYPEVALLISLIKNYQRKIEIQRYSGR